MTNSGAILEESSHSGAIPVESGHSCGFRCHSGAIPAELPDSGRNLWGTVKYWLVTEATWHVVMTRDDSRYSLFIHLSPISSELLLDSNDCWRMEGNHKRHSSGKHYLYPLASHTTKDSFFLL